MPARVFELQQFGKQALKSGNDQSSINLDIDLLLCACLDKSRIFLYTYPEHQLTFNQRRVFLDHLLRRLAGEPLAYIIGFKEFFSHRFLVNPDVLIPRPETELLVESVCQELEIRQSRHPDQACKVLEIGTGSGCISISINLKQVKAKIDAVDICPNALDVAMNNQSRLGSQVNFSAENALCESTWKGRYDTNILVSNPPYIARSEECDLAINVKGYEPAKALFADRDGLRFYHAMAGYGAKYFKEGTKGFFEIGSSQALAVKDIFQTHGWRQVVIHNDYNQRPRVLTCELNKSNVQRSAALL